MQRKKIILFSLYTRLININFKRILSDFKNGALRTTTDVTRAGVELTVSLSRNVTYFSTILTPKKSYFTIFTIQNFV